MSWVHLVPFFYLPTLTSIQTGVSKEIGTSVLTFFGVGSIFGRFVLGAVVTFKWIGPLTFSSFGFLCCGVCNMLSIIVQTYWEMSVVSALNGFGMGVYCSMYSMAGMDLFGVRDFPFVYGICYCLGTIGFLLGPVTLGYFHELSHDDGNVVVMAIAAGGFTMASMSALLCKFKAGQQYSAKSELNKEKMPLLK